jgi:hypothetical protein
VSLYGSVSTDRRGNEARTFITNRARDHGAVHPPYRAIQHSVQHSGSTYVSMQLIRKDVPNIPVGRV